MNILHLAGSKKFAGKERINYSFYEELYFAPGKLKFCDKDNVLDLFLIFYFLNYQNYYFSQWEFHWKVPDPLYLSQ